MKDNSSFRDDKIKPVKFINHLESIKATLYNAPSMKELETYIKDIHWVAEKSMLVLDSGNSIQKGHETILNQI